MVTTWRQANSDSKARGLSDFCMNHLSWISPAKMAEKIKAHIQIHASLNPAIIRKDYDSWEKNCSETVNTKQFPKHWKQPLFFSVGEQLLMVENYIIFS